MFRIEAALALLLLPALAMAGERQASRKVGRGGAAQAPTVSQLGITKVRVSTGLGRSDDWHRLGLSKGQVAELNSIGASGKTRAGRKMTFQDYLNGLGNGKTYQVTQTKYDSGDFSEEFEVLAVPTAR